jgi:hypothetical protein
MRDKVRRIIVLEEEVDLGEDPDIIAECVPDFPGARVVLYHEAFSVGNPKGYLCLNDVGNDSISSFLDPSGVREGIPTAEALKKLQGLIAMAHAVIQRIT